MPGGPLRDRERGRESVEAGKGKRERKRFCVRELKKPRKRKRKEKNALPFFLLPANHKRVGQHEPGRVRARQVGSVEVLSRHRVEARGGGGGG